MMAGAMALPSMSASDWVANTTLAFFLRSVFSHSRSCAPKDASSSASQPSSTISSVGSPVRRPLDAVEQVGQHGRRGAGADQALGLEDLDVAAAPRRSAVGIQQAAPWSRQAL